jgi:hypothetical protein
MLMPVRGVIAHHVPGRLRVRFSEARASSTTLFQIAHVFAKIDGVSRVEVNAITGSILLSYEPTLNGHFPLTLLENPANGSLFKIENSDPIPGSVCGGEDIHTRELSLVAGSIIDTFRTVNRRVKHATRNKVDLAVLLPLTVAAMALAKRGSAQGTPFWITLGIFAFQSFLTLNPTGSVSTKPR